MDREETPMTQRTRTAGRKRFVSIATATFAFVTSISAGASVVLRQSEEGNETPAAEASAPTASTQTSAIRLPRTRSVAEEDRNALLEEAAQGDKEAMLKLAWLYYRPSDGTPNHVAARKWFIAASEAGDARAKVATAFFLARGLGGAQDIARARELLQEAGQAGLARAGYVRWVVESQYPGTRKQQEARQALEESAQAGDPLAQNALGVLLESEGDILRSQQLYESAARNGYKLAAQNLQRLQRAGPTADRSAILQLRAAAADGDAEAMFQLAERLHKGVGTQRNLGEAMNLYSRAATLGHRGAREMLALIMSRPPRDSSERFNASWMLELSSKIHLTGPATSSIAPRRDDDPLAGLLELRP